MRRLLISILFVAGCGGGTTSPAPTPPPPPAPPTPPPPPPPSPIDVVLDAAPLGQAGGTLRVTKVGSALFGLGITVPAGAFAGGTQWTVSEMKEVRPSFPARLRQVGPTIRIRNGQGFAEQPFVLAIPARVRADSGVAAFFRDPATGTLELIPVVARTDTSLIVVTRHVSADQMAPASVAAALRAAPSVIVPPGELEIVIVAAALADLTTEIRGDYRPGVDDWEFANRGSYLTPGGYCAGSTISSLYHNYVRKASKGSLFGLYDDTDAFELDNRRGIRLASVVHDKIRWRQVLDTMLAQTVQRSAASVGVTASGGGWAQLQTQVLGLAMLATGHAQLLGVYRAGWLDGHSIVTQGIVQGSIYVTDPNVPGVERTLTWDAQGFTPFPFSVNADIASEIYSEVFVMGMSAMVPMTTLGALWDQVESKTVGDAEFPNIRTEYRDPVDTLWRPLSAEVRTASSQLVLRTRCSDCVTIRPPPANPADRVLSIILDSQGKTVAADPNDATEGALFPVAMGKMKVPVRHDAYPQDGNGYPFYVDFSWMDVDRVPFKLLRSRFQGIVGQEVTWSVDNGGMGGPGSKYRYTFAPDPTPIEIPFGGTSVTYRFKAKNLYRPKVELFDAAGIRLAVDSGQINIGEGYHWRMDCAEVKSDSPASGISGAEATAYQRWIGYFTRAAGNPSDGFLSLLTPTTFRTFASFFALAKAGEGATARQMPLFPGDSLNSPNLDTRVYTGTTNETPGGAPGFSRSYNGGVHDLIFGADMLTDVEFSVSPQGWGRGVIYASVWGTNARTRLRFYARQIWEPNPAPAPPCSFTSNWP